jgi:uncharacterized membrane protein
MAAQIRRRRLYRYGFFSVSASLIGLYSPVKKPADRDRLNRLSDWLTVAALAWLSGYSLREGWIVLSILLYVVTGLFWLLVVWMQMRMRDLAGEAATAGISPPKRYNQLFRLWFAFGFPAFASVATIYWLMITRPAFELF